MIYKCAKRWIDGLASAAALGILWPLLIVIAVAIRLESPGSPIFVQQRVGRNGKPFNLLKFRSMVRDASRIGSWHTAENDPRITRVGRFLRATSLDELPQLWNVLVGDMSLIGPRPNTPAQQAQYSPEHWEMRHRVRPGITGLAQVNGRSAITVEEQAAFDVAYASEFSLAGDMRILLKTVGLVFRKTGVN
jgi:lipopolysaccharide/colanic/teichoic acid biosynthesis glycosyltransferase